MMENLKSRLIYVLIAIVVGVAGGLLVNNSRRVKEVTIKFDAGSSVSIYKNSGSKKPPQYEHGSNSLFHLNHSGKIKLRYGSYVSVLDDPGHMYNNPLSTFTINAGSKTIVIDQSYSSQKLASLLPAARAQIATSMNAAYPQAASTYNVSKDSLYGKGDWYGEVITPKSLSQDTVRVIWNKTDGFWTIVAFPNISIGRFSHPSIPASIVEAVDQL